MKRYLLAFLSLAMAAHPASAQLLGPNQPPDQWVMSCSLEKGRDCGVSALIDGGPDNLLGTFLIVRYSVATATLTVAVQGTGQSASLQIDWHPFLTTTLCGGAECLYQKAGAAEVLQQMLAGQQLVVQASLLGDSFVGPLRQSLNGFAAQYRRAVAAQQGR
jgi:hypothetical protein